MQKKLFVISIWIVAFLLIVTNIVVNPTSFFVNGTVILGWLLLAVQYTSNHSERFYLLLKRLWFNILNPTCIWNMQVVLHGNFNRTVFQKLDAIFYDLSKEFKDFKITSVSNTRKIYKLHTINLEVVFDEENEVINFYIHDFEVSFRDSKHIIDKKLAKIFEKVQYAVKANSGNYGIHVDFKKYNPYFGFFVRRLDDREINSFNVRFTVEDDQVSVSKGSIEINSTSLQNLNNLSKDYLALSRPL